MKILIFIFITLLSVISTQLLGQNAKIDSLNKVIASTKVDTVKGRSLCLLCEELRLIGDNDLGIRKGQEGLTISQKINDNKGIAHCLYSLGNIYNVQGNKEKALEYYGKSLRIFNKLNYKVGRANCLGNIGVIYKDQGNLSKAMEYYQISMDLYEQIKNNKGIAKTLNNMAEIYLTQGNYPKALDYYQKSLKIFVSLSNSMGISICLSNIASIYSNEKRYDKAMEFYQRSLKIEEKIGNQSGVADCLFSIGNIYINQLDFSNAFEAYNKSMILFEKIGDINGVALALNNLGTVSEVQGNFPKALIFHLKSLKLRQQIHDTADISVSYFNISKNYIKLNKPHLAKEYAKKGLILAKQVNYLKNMVWLERASSQADSALGDYKSAYEHYKLYKQYSDSLHNDEKSKEFGKIESKFQFEKEAEDQKRKEAEAAKLLAEQNQRRDNLQYLTIFAGIIGLFAGLVFMGKFRIPERVMDIALFAGLLITFEFLLILFDPIFEKYSGGIPLYKLGFNTLVAFGFAPLHSWLEDKLRKRLLK